MPQVKSFKLKNGLQVVVEPIKGAAVVASNLMYRVGARDEEPQQAGISHLFEHLAFGPSPYVANYDKALQEAGGVNNAYTGLDVTSYYTKLYAKNIETLFWLESNRMLGISHDDTYLSVQRKVVVEEFKQVVLNQPYGDEFSTLLAASYPNQPGSYRWSPIGKKAADILSFTKQALQQFEATYYAPQNAVLAISGGTSFEEVFRLAQKWFAPIPKREAFQVKKYEEIEKIPYKKKRIQKEDKKFPAHRVYKAYPTARRGTERFFYYLLLMQILLEGRGGVLVDQLVDKKKICTGVEGFTLETFGPGLFVLILTLRDNQSPALAEEALYQLFNRLLIRGFNKSQLERAKNQLVTAYHLRQSQMENRAHDLALSAWLGDINFFSQELNRIQKAEEGQLSLLLKEMLQEFSATLVYHRKN